MGQEIRLPLLRHDCPLEERVALNKESLPTEVALQGQCVGIMLAVVRAALDEELVSALKKKSTNLIFI